MANSDYTYEGILAGTGSYKYETPVVVVAGVKTMQTNLAKIGYTIDIDGKFGPGCETVVKSFQTANGLTVDGKAGPATIGKLDQLVKGSTTSPTITAMLNKFETGTTYKHARMDAKRKASMIAIGRDMAKKNYYEAAFIVGLMANILKEGNIGQFQEASGNTSPYYYKDNYSLKHVFNTGMNLSTIKAMAGALTFGLGCVQWTKSTSNNRTLKLVEAYLVQTGNSNTITEAKALSAEVQLLHDELTGTHSLAYTGWKSANNSNLHSAAAAKSAGRWVSEVLEGKADETNKADRGGIAEAIYTVMVS